MCVATIQLCHCRGKKAIDCPETNECVCEPIKLCLWTFKCEFYIIFMSWNFFLLIFSQLSENVKTILSSQALQKQVVDQLWPTGSSLPDSSLRYGALYAKSGYSMRRIHKKPALVAGKGKGGQNSRKTYFSLYILSCFSFVPCTNITYSQLFSKKKVHHRTFPLLS